MTMEPNRPRFWFLIHFVVDVVFAMPLLVAPGLTLSLFGWTTVDLMATRLVGAALMGIGVESLLGRKAGVEVYRAMLNLKIIWSLSAVIGIGASMADGGPATGWAVLGVFGAFCGLWIYYRIRLRGRS
jgi:hypothetical protein